MSDGVDPRAELGVCAVIVVACAAVLIEAAQIRPGVFEPLGSGPVPRATAWAIIVLCLVVMARAVLRLRITGPEPAAAAIRPRWLDAAAVLALTLGYVAVLHLRLTTFALMTTAYLLASIGLLVRLERRLLPWVALVAALVGFGSQYVFTRIFVVDLPGL
jgi:cytochrome b561